MMRKYHQKQLLELVNSLHEAHSEIKPLFSKGQINTIINLLSDCQQSAVRIGGFIEQLEGEGARTVTFLEEYCELLYQVSVEISGSVGAKGSLKRLQKQLYIIENSVQTDLKPDRLEMLFIPYKASMWDSMESIWLTAKNDPRCEAVVMPVPYFDRQPDGTLGKMHYEGGEYPNYVPVADWRKYNLEERHPDVIVTSNPYDEGNYVSSIHPDFYSRRLKSFTDLLIYVPYFVSVDDVPGHFCVCAGTLYADRTIVQSERVRKTYLREFRKAEKEKKYKGEFGNAETKFISLGSPKFDRVIRTKREDCRIPDEWRKLIEKPDGTCRKVVLYNTNIFGALKDNEKALHKLRHVFQCFQDREDVILLWRPHPLNTAVYQSMRPQLLQEYLDIVGEFKSLGVGIYDDTPDLNRAIAISDAYYGDLSSLVIMCQCVGKPVMIQSADVIKPNDQSKHLAIDNLYFDGKDFWFTAYDFNALFKMDRQTWKTEYIGSFPGEPFDGKKLYGQIAGYNGKLYFSPAFADEIAEYDTVNRIFKKTRFREKVEGEELCSTRGPKFNEVFQYQRWLFFIGNTCPALIRLDVETGEIDSFSDWRDSLGRLTVNFDGYHFKSACVVGTKIAMAALNANAVVVFDMESCTSEVYEVGRRKNGYTGICFDGDNYWLSPRFGGPVIRWNPEKGYKEYGDYPDGFVGGRGGFWDLRYLNDCVWLFPNQANMALKINVQEESILVAEEFQPECHEAGGAPSYIFSKIINGAIFAHTGKTSRLIEFDGAGNQRREEAVCITEVDSHLLNDIQSNIFKKDSSVCETAWDCMFAESDRVPLDHFLISIDRFGDQAQARALSARQVEICRSTIENADGTAGESIYAYCKQALLVGAGGKK